MMNRLLLIIALLLMAMPVMAQDFALKQLEESPRHHEWVTVTHDDREVYCFVAYPERATNAPVIIVIHENRGLTDWVRSLTDRLAEAGYLAIAPDLLSNFKEGIEKTSDFSSSDDARNAIYKLEKEQVLADLDAVHAYAQQLPAAQKTPYVMGFCWGGSRTFQYATHNENLSGALVFYGTAPKEEGVFTHISAPVYGFYGGNDQRVNATIPTTESYMTAAEKAYTYEMYEGAGHAFMRRGDAPDSEGPNKEARDAAWERIKSIIQ